MHLIRKSKIEKGFDSGDFTACSWRSLILTISSSMEILARYEYLWVRMSWDNVVEYGCAEYVGSKRAIYDGGMIQ